MASSARLNEDKESSPCLERGDRLTVNMLGTQRRITLDVLMALWGMGTWLGVNGLFVQLPLLVERQPEGWALPSSMVLFVQLANSGLLFYALLRRFIPSISDKYYIYALLVIGTTALLLNAFLHEQTAVIGSDERSVAYLSLTYFVALVGCTSSVLFYPYLRHFRDMYLATYLVGEGLSGFVTSLLSLVQGVGGEPVCEPDDNGKPVPHYPPARFDTMVFLLLLSVLSATSLASFFIINNYKGFQSERVEPAAAAKDDEATAERPSLAVPRWVGVMALMALMNAVFNGLMPSVQSYSCMPYGTRAYHLSVSLGAMANPAACLAGVWLRPVTPRALGVMLVLSLAPFSYMLATALLSPTPPLQHSGFGEFLVVSSWVLVSGVISYVRMWVYGWARQGGARGMRLCGGIGQLGSVLGSASTFFLVNFTSLFVQPEACPTAPLLVLTNS